MMHPQDPGNSGSTGSTGTPDGAPDDAQRFLSAVRRAARHRTTRMAVRAGLKGASAGLHAGLVALELASDLTPGLRMTGRRRLPQNMSAGLLGAEVATWAAISPSLLPRPWWVTAANVAIGQAAGHLAAATSAYALKSVLRTVGKRPQDRVKQRVRRNLHLGMGATTVAMTALSLSNQAKQARLVAKSNERGPAQAAFGAAVGTVGYGGLLLLGEAVQASVSGLSKELGRWLPALVAWPLAAGALAFSAAALSDKVVLRRVVRSLSVHAQRMNRAVMPGSIMPWEPERSGSPWSYEPWSAVGREGRVLLSHGPRAADIKEVMEYDHAHEPIRIYAGLVPGRSFHAAARQVIAEMERTGAFRRDTIVIQMPAGSGWLSNWSVSAYEFLTRGDCATVTMQYSYLPSVFSYLVDPAAPKEAALELINAVRFRLDDLPADDRPKLYFAGESLGAYAIVDNYDTLDDLLAACDGAVFTGPPRMTTFVKRLARDPGSLERLPVVDGGRHVRFAAVPAHTRHDAFGASYAQFWARPRVLFAQHASDAIVWWERRLAFQRPRWLREPQPDTLYADTFARLPWVPFITFWQVGLDQINSLNVPGGHGHNYFEENFWYWNEVLGSQSRRPLNPRIAQKMASFMAEDQLY